MAVYLITKKYHYLRGTRSEFLPQMTPKKWVWAGVFFIDGMLLAFIALLFAGTIDLGYWLQVLKII